MKMTTKMAVTFLALAVAQVAVIPAAYTDDEGRKGATKTRTHGGEKGEKVEKSERGEERHEPKSTSPTTLPTVPATSLPTVPATSLPTVPTTSLPTVPVTTLPMLGTTPPPSPAPAPTQTWALYNQYCAGCHGTSKQGKSAAAIQAAIGSFSQMAPLKTLTPAQISDLAAGQ